MNEQEIIIKAIEIAINLTKADNTYLREDERGYIGIKEPLFSTIKTVYRLLHITDIERLKKEIKMFQDF
jgi:hypothetical protein